MAVHVETDVLPSGWRAVRLRNDEVEVTLLPEKGSEIYALRSLRHDIDVLWKSPWGLRPPPVPSSSGPESQAVWLDYYGGGWQDIFPNGGDACTVDGVPLSMHGEASVVPWTYELGTGDGGVPEVRLEVRLARSPFRLQKRVWLAPDRPLLHLWERVTNEGADALPFMWGHHPAYGAPFLDGGCRLEIPAATFLADETQTSPQSWLISGERSAWPVVPRTGGGTIDLSQVPGPDTPVANLGYVTDLTDGWYALTNPRLGLGVGLAWPREVFPCVWLWQELKGTRAYPWYGAVYVMGVEPHTSYPGHGLGAALERGTARTLGAGQHVEATLSAVLFQPRGRVQRITPAGDVQFAPD